VYADPVDTLKKTQALLMRANRRIAELEAALAALKPAPTKLVEIEPVPEPTPEPEPKPKTIKSKRKADGNSN